MSSPTDDLALIRRAIEWYESVTGRPLTDEGVETQALAALTRLGEQLAEQADALHVTCVARDSTGKPMKSVHLLGDPEAVRAVFEMRTAGEAAEARVSQLEDALRDDSHMFQDNAIEDLIGVYLEQPHGASCDVVDEARRAGRDARAARRARAVLADAKTPAPAKRRPRLLGRTA